MRKQNGIKYQQRKEHAREEAKKWQNSFENNSYSWGEVAYYSKYFTERAKRYGLIKEFRNNGII